MDGSLFGFLDFNVPPPLREYPYVPVFSSSYSPPPNGSGLLPAGMSFPPFSALFFPFVVTGPGLFFEAPGHFQNGFFPFFPLPLFNGASPFDGPLPIFPPFPLGQISDPWPFPLPGLSLFISLELHNVPLVSTWKPFSPRAIFPRFSPSIYASVSVSPPYGRALPSKDLRSCFFFPAPLFPPRPFSKGCNLPRAGHP